MLHATLGLDDILQREITIDWFEGVAVIQAVCRAVPGSSSSGTGFPTARQISLKATGEIELLGVTPGPDAVVAAGRLLGEMLHNDVPVRLRLIHSEAVATRPRESQARLTHSRHTEPVARHGEPQRRQRERRVQIDGGRVLASGIPVSATTVQPLAVQKRAQGRE